MRCNNKMNRAAIFILLTIFAVNCFAQDAENIEPTTDMGMPLNTMTAGFGVARDLEHSHKFSNFGFDYLRRFHPKWEAGIQLDFEWDEGYTTFEGTAVAGIVAYNITNKWPVFAGFGVASKKEQTDAFFRAGTEYTFFLNDDGSLFLAPGTFSDVYPDDITISAMVVIGWVW